MFFTSFFKRDKAYDIIEKIVQGEYRASVENISDNLENSIESDLSPNLTKNEEVAIEYMEELDI